MLYFKFVCDPSFTRGIFIGTTVRFYSYFKFYNS